MVVAEKKYYYNQPELEEKQIHKKEPSKKKKPKNYRLEKLMIFSAIFIILGSSLFLLLRYSKIIEARYTIHTLNNQLEKLEDQTQKIRIEVERATNSRFIENQAVSRLNMTYPSSDKTMYINVDNVEVSEISNHLNQRFNSVQ